MSTPSPVESYETLYAELQQIVARLETGDLPLADSLALYERGIQLAGTCQNLLETAELRIRQLQSTDDTGNG
jgi:exodeoxyribonuclease VII small subunit